MKIRLINTEEHSPSMNMGIDEALLGSSLPVLRFYRWEPPGLSIGYSQSISHIDIEFCRKNKIEIVRRLTGGRAILHDKELTYSIIADIKLMPGSIRDSYRRISTGILKSLEILGLKAQMNKEVNAETISAACFHEPSWYEIIVNNRKLVGSAQKRTRGKVLQHGSILIDINIEKYSGCFTDSEKMAEALMERLTTINAELKRKVDYREVLEAMKRGFADGLGMEFIDDELTDKELQLAERLRIEKYSNNKWNFMR